MEAGKKSPKYAGWAGILEDSGGARVKGTTGIINVSVQA